MASVLLKDIEKIYPNGFRAVRGQSLIIDDGEFMVIVGPSGCGKSTTLNMIAGLEELSGGEIWIGDRLVNDLPPKGRDVAIVFQSYALYPHMNVYDNMAFGLKLQKHAKKEIDQRVKKAAEILGITDLLSKKPKALSGGERQRAALGRAIVREPNVFLFDEPLSNLDAKLRGHMRVELAKLHKSLKTTMIYVTHDQMEAMTMGDRICVMESGVIKQVDTPLNLYDNPADKFVATFVGSPSMNIVEVSLARREGDIYVITPDGIHIRLPEVKAGKLGDHIRKKIWLGIRPEDIDSREGRAGEDSSIKGDVDVVEQMGNEIFVYFNTGKDQYTARLNSGIDIRPGEGYEFSFDMAKCHVFDMETGVNVTL